VRVLRIAPWSPRRGSDDPADDERLVAGLRAHESWAMGALIERHGRHVERVLFRVLGSGDADCRDLAQEVFVDAWQGIARLQEPAALRAWLTQIAVFTAKGAIRRRHRRRWLRFFADVPETSVSWAGPDIAEAAQAVYAIFDRMPIDERIPFALRMFDGLGLEATAAACSMSVATVRRRLAKAERRFFLLAAQYDALLPWLNDRTATP
jgi:RNA polymerase sigma-70 factor, ECF subfamily